MALLLNAVTVDTTGAAFTMWDYSQQHIDYRPFTLLISGTMGGGTAKVQVSNDKVTWLDAYSTTVTIGILFESTARYARATLTGSSGATVTVELT